MKKLSLFVLFGLLVVSLLGYTITLSESTADSERNPSIKTSEALASLDSPKRLLQPGEVFETNTYISFAGIEIAYDGENFLVTNTREDAIMISASVVGVKTDGSYEVIQIPSFSGLNQSKYENDLAGNGWALQSYTNIVNSESELSMSLSIFDFNAVDESYPEADIDGDGYYDIVFTINPQYSEDTIFVSTDALVSEVYKLKVI